MATNRNRKNIRVAANIADHFRSVGLKHKDVIAKIIELELATDEAEADALLYDADIASACHATEQRFVEQWIKPKRSNL